VKTQINRGLASSADVLARPGVGAKKILRNKWIIAKYSPIPYEKVVAAVGELAARRVRVWERAGRVFVSLREIANKLGKAVALQLRPAPDWVDPFWNNVVHEGLDHSLNQHLKGAAYTAAWYIGLTDGTPTVADTDTISSHAGWTEVTAYDETFRQTLTLGAVSGQSVDNSASKGTFSINGSTTVGGAFLISGDGGTAKGGATNGTLYGAGAFTGGDRSLNNGDTLNVQLTLTAGTA
jgi:hypothetical protein